MTTETRVTAQSLDDYLSQHVLVADSLEQIAGTSRALVRRFHLNRDWIIGLVGDRGSGKSLGGGNIAVRDFAMNIEPIWSNMQIGLDVDISDDYAGRFLKENEDGTLSRYAGGIASFRSDHIDKQAFLALDSQYEGGCLFFDEFNLEYGEARRSSANVNLLTDRAIQQLRKLQCGLIYTVLNEVYVDTRIRENTDIFIRCSDVAFKPENLRQKMRQGEQFEWLVYPMSSKVSGLGHTYADTNKPIGPIPITMRHLWGSIDTYERQASGRTKYTDTGIGAPKELMPLNIKEDPSVVAERDAWGWLDQNLLRFFEKHTNDGDRIDINSNDFRVELGVKKEDWTEVVKHLRRKMPNMDDNGQSGFKRKKFYVPNRTLPL